MRRSVVAVLAGLVLSPSYVAAVAPPCTDVGTAERDMISGTDSRDVICAGGGPDYVAGKGGPDRLRAGWGKDTVVGGSGHDRLRGGHGADSLFAVDGRGGDFVSGGAGFDRCYGEKRDTFRRCEVVRTNGSPTYPLEVALALSNAIDRTITAGEAIQADEPPCDDHEPPGSC